MAGTSPAMTAEGVNDDRGTHNLTHSGIEAVHRCVMAGLVPAIHGTHGESIVQLEIEVPQSGFMARIRRTFQARGQCFMFLSRWMAAETSS